MEKEQSIKRPAIAGFLAGEYNKLVNFVRKRIADGSDRDAEDIIQDVIVKLYEASDFNVPAEKLTSYIYTAVRNKIIDVFRTRKDHLSLDDPDHSMEFALAQVIQDAPADDSSDMKEKVYMAIDTLSEDERAVVIATEFDDISFKELAEEWETPIGTLLSRKKRALDKIKTILIKEV
jgi:RNA polymerase sigma-70 factor (ECF subfamily)